MLADNGGRYKTQRHPKWSILRVSSDGYERSRIGEWRMPLPPLLRLLQTEGEALQPVGGLPNLPAHPLRFWFDVGARRRFGVDPTRDAVLERPVIESLTSL